jgi:hypothetical protein
LRFIESERVGHQLQFAQHELRDHQRAVQKAGFGNVRDPPVNDDAGIQNLEGLLGRLLASEDARRTPPGSAPPPC